MPRQAANEAQQAQKTAAGNAAGYGANASGLYGPLTANAESLVNSKGYDPSTLAAINNAGMGAVGSAFGSAGGAIKRNAAVTGNAAGVGANLDKLAMDKGIAGGDVAAGTQIANAQFQNQQRTQGLNLLNSLYGTNVAAQTGNEGIRTGDINAQVNASPGWAQTLSQIIGATGQAVGGGSGFSAAKNA